MHETLVASEKGGWRISFCIDMGNQVLIKKKSERVKGEGGEESLHSITVFFNDNAHTKKRRRK